MKLDEWRNELITKGAAFDALTEVESHYEFEDGHDHLMSWAKTKIFALPSAQPELIEKSAYIRGFEQGRTQGMLDARIATNLQPTCNQLATDCISRADADMVEGLIYMIPSAQPQHNVRFSDVDHVWIDGKQYISLQRFGEAVKDAQPETICCKDCEWWTKQKDSLQGRCALMQMYPTGGWFCANARRKER